MKNYHVNSCVNGDSMALPGRANINNGLAQQRNQMKVFFAPHLFPYNWDLKIILCGKIQCHPQLGFVDQHLQFKKETTELSQREHERVLEEIDQLNPINLRLIYIDYEMDAASPRRDNVKVTYDLALTMVDQKVINALTETSLTMRCYICKATPKCLMTYKAYQDQRMSLIISMDSAHSISGFVALRWWSTFPIDFLLKNGLWHHKKIRL